MTILIPLNMRKIDPAIVKRAKPRTGINKMCSWFLKLLKSTTGPAMAKGSEPARNLIPFIRTSLLVCFLSSMPNFCNQIKFSTGFACTKL